MSAPAPDQARLDRLRVLLWIGGVGAALVTVAGLFGFHDGSIWKLPRLLQSHAEAAMSAAGLPGLEIEMDGQTAMLRGVVANASARTAAHQAALTSAGPGGPWAGGVTSVNASGVTIGGTERPFSWSMRREGGAVTLSGVAPSSETKGALVLAARAAFPNATVADTVRVAGGAPTSHWRAAAVEAIQALAPFQSAEARFDDENIVFIVRGSQAQIGALRQRYQTPTPPFHARVDVVEGAP